MATGADDRRAGRPIEVELATIAGIRVATVRGEVDLDSSERLEEGLAPARDGQGPVVLDLTGVPFMDSTGLHVVILFWCALSREGRPLAIVCGGRLRRLFEVTGLDATFSLYPTLEAAIDALRRGEPRARANAS